MSRDLTRPHYWGIMRIYGWEFLVVCHQIDKFGGHVHYESGYMYLICHVTICFMSGNCSLYVTTLPSLEIIGIMVVVDICL